jgi:hypothetical protein
MLILGKKYDEEILPWLLNGLKKALEKDNMKLFNKLIEPELKNKDDNMLKEHVKEYLTVSLKDKTIQPVVRYGDSVIGDTPLLLREKKSKDIIIKSIKELGTMWSNMLEDGKEDKEYQEVNLYEI